MCGWFLLQKGKKVFRYRKISRQTYINGFPFDIEKRKPWGRNVYRRRRRVVSNTNNSVTDVCTGWKERRKLSINGTVHWDRWQQQHQHNIISRYVSYDCVFVHSMDFVVIIHVCTTRQIAVLMTGPILKFDSIHYKTVWTEFKTELTVYCRVNSIRDSLQKMPSYGLATPYPR